MAIIDCPECKGNVSDQAEKCPHCGFKIPSKKMGCLGYIIAGIAVLFVFSLLGKPSDTSPRVKTESDKKKDAYYMCQVIIKPMLKNPDSADFEGFEFATFTGMGLDNWDIEMMVRSTNSFNAIVPSTFICTAKAHNGTATVTNIKNLN